MIQSVRSSTKLFKTKNKSITKSGLLLDRSDQGAKAEGVLKVRRDRSNAELSDVKANRQ